MAMYSLNTSLQQVKSMLLHNEDFMSRTQKVLKPIAVIFHLFLIGHGTRRQKIWMFVISFIQPLTTGGQGTSDLTLS